MGDSITPYYDPILDKIRSIDNDADGGLTFDPYLEQLRAKDIGSGVKFDPLLNAVRQSTVAVSAPTILSASVELDEEGMAIFSGTIATGRLSTTVKIMWGETEEALINEIQAGTITEDGGITKSVDADTFPTGTIYWKMVATNSSGSDESDVQGALLNQPLAFDFATLPDGALPAKLTGETFSIVNGKAVNTPIEGEEILTDGGLENWTSATNLTSWSELIPSGGAIEQEQTIKRTGSSAAKIVVNSSGSRTEISQTPTVDLHEFYNSRFYGKASLANKGFRAFYDNQINLGYHIMPTDDFELKVSSHIKKTATGALMFQNYGNNDTTFYIDDCSLKKITKTTLFATTDLAKTDGTAKAFWNTIRGTMSGVIMNLDSISNPLNFVMYLSNGINNNTFLIKSVNGVISQVALINVTGDSMSQLIELRKSGTTYKCYINGVQVGADQTISDASIVNNTINGIVSTYSGNTCERFYTGEGADIVSVPNAATISDYYKYVSSGDTLALATDGTYTFAALHLGFSTLPVGTSARRTTVNGNGSTITAGAVGISLTSKNYFTFNDLTLVDQTAGAVNITSCNYLTFNNVVGNSNNIGAGYLDCYKQTHCTNLEWNDCEAGPCVGAAPTCDGFEDWDNEDVTYNNCTAHGFQNGAEEYNNGHGFESYAGNVAGEICKRITYNNCHAYDCRVGFSCEGGPLAAAHEDIKAINCTTATCSIADAGGVDGATLKVTAGTLLNRTGSVVEI